MNTDPNNNFGHSGDHSRPQPEIIRDALVDQLYTRGSAGYIGAIAGAVVLTVALWNLIPGLHLALWLAAYVLVQVLRLMLIYRYSQTGRDSVDSRLWERRFATGNVVGGLLWGLAAIFLFPENSVPHQYMLALFISGIACGAAAFYWPSTVACYPTIVVELVPISGRFFFKGDETGIVTGLVILLFCVVVLLMARNLNSFATDSLRLRFEKEGLAESLQKARDKLESRVQERTAELSRVNHELRHEISERVRAEESLSKSEERYRLVVENVQESIFVARDGLIRFVNPMAVELFEYSESELLSKLFIELIHPADQDLVHQTHVRRLQGERFPERYSVRIMNKAGALRWVEITNVLIQWDDLPAVLVFMTDITNRREAEQALRQSEERYRAFFETSGDGVFMTDLEGRFIDVNTSMIEMLGYDPRHKEELLRTNVAEYYANPEDRKTHATGVSSMEFSREYPIDLRKRDGTIIHTLGTTVTREDQYGTIVGFQGTIRDITERIEAEKALRLSEERFRLISETATDTIWCLDKDYLFTYVSSADEKMRGFKAQELIGRSIFTVINPASRDAVKEAALKRTEDENRGIKTGMLKHELELVCKDGSYVWTEGYVTPIRDEGGKISGYVGITRDISERKLADDLLRLRLTLLEYSSTHSLEELLQKTLDEIGSLTNSPIGFYHFISDDEKTIYLQMWSTRTTKEFCQAEGKGRHYQVDQAGVWADAITERRPVIHNDYSSLPNRKGMPKGHAPVIREVVVPIMRSDRIVAVLGIGNKPTDYTEKDVEVGSYLADVTWEIARRKRAEKELRESERKFRLVTETIQDVFWVSAPDMSQLIYVSPSYEKMWEKTTESLYESPRSFLDSVHPDDLEQYMSILKKHPEGKQYTCEYRIVQDDGSVRWILERGYPIYDEQGILTSICGVSTDITQRKQGEKALQESEERLELALKGADLGLWDWNVPFNRAFVDQRAAEMVGHTFDEIGDNLGFWEGLLHPDDRQRALEKVSNHLSGLTDLYEDEYRVRHKSGHWIWILSRGKVTQRDPAGKPLRMTGTYRDITDRKEAEQEQEHLRAQLFQAQKMESIGTLAGGIAHDFNNLLQVTLGYSELLMQEKTVKNPDYADLQKILHAARSGAELVQRLLMFSRKSEPKPVPTNLNRQIVQVEKLLRRTIPRMVDIHLDLSPDLPDIYADPSQVEQVLMNLAVNARDAMPDGGSLTVKTARETLDETYCRGHVGTNPGEYVLLEISDTGSGMEKETVEHIFEPFFTTKEIGRGTGLGLAMVYGVVKQHNGHITVYSAVGQGATFKIYLPAIPREIEPDMASTMEMPAFGTETVLIVDDEDSVRELGERVLAQSGYTVFTACNGIEALEVYEKEKKHVALVILDLIMPTMGGRDCLRKILDIDPKAKVLIASGYSAEASESECFELGAKGFVTKPFRFKELLRQVRKTLDQD